MLVLYGLVLCAALPARSQDFPVLPDYVSKYAPLVYLDVNEQYLPSDIGAQVSNTNPDLNFTQMTDVPSDLALINLNSLNAPGSCSVDDFGDCDVYLTSKQNVTTDPRPSWLYGVLPDSDGYTQGAISSAIIVNDHGNGLVDAFYFYFYAFNEGLNVSGQVLGNHVGDWEHTMVRFTNGTPSTIWYSAHDDGFAYTYDAVSKNNSRPIVYSSLGGHANYPTPGLQSRDEGIIVLNDTTSQGPLWDPTLSAFYYTFTPTSSNNGTFQPAIAASGPSAQGYVEWLYFAGRWGDKQYPSGTGGQVVLGSISATYQDGPTGPLDKDLNRLNTCPNDDNPCSTTSTLPTPSGTTKPAYTLNTRITAPTPSADAVSGVLASSTSISGTVTGSVLPTGTSSTVSPSHTGNAAIAAAGEVKGALVLLSVVVSYFVVGA